MTAARRWHRATYPNREVQRKPGEHALTEGLGVDADGNVLVQHGLEVSCHAVDGGIVGRLERHERVAPVVDGGGVVGVPEPKARFRFRQVLEVEQLHNIGCLEVLQLLVCLDFVPQLRRCDRGDEGCVLIRNADTVGCERSPIG